MSKDEPSEPMIFLYEGDIVDFHPVREGYWPNPMIRDLGVQTDVMAFLGLDEIDLTTGNWRVRATAARYLASIVRFSYERIQEHPDESKLIPRQMVLFNGGIEIYRFEVIPGTRVTGADLVEQGRIWFARGPLPESSGTLMEHIFGEKEGPERAEVVGQIVRGYQYQEDSGRDAELRSRFNEYDRGRLEAEEAAYGTFGTGHFRGIRLGR